MPRLVIPLVAAACLSVVSAASLAQPAPLTRLRGTIDKIEGRTLSVTSRTGIKVALPLSAKLTVGLISPGSIEDLKPGLYVGAAGVPQPDGTLRALEIHIFAASLRGMAEGSMPWDSGPGSSMTNGTIGEVVGTIGRNMTVRYGTEEKKIVVPPSTPIVTDEPSTEAALIPGANVIAFVSHPQDGPANVARVLVGKDGLVPPM